ncbi:hypothetical protein MMPV_001996 [Pyropia vietnamensis]
MVDRRAAAVVAAAGAAGCPGRAPPPGGTAAAVGFLPPLSGGAALWRTPGHADHWRRSLPRCRRRPPVPTTPGRTAGAAAGAVASPAAAGAPRAPTAVVAVTAAGVGAGAAAPEPPNSGPADRLTARAEAPGGPGSPDVADGGFVFDDAGGDSLREECGVVGVWGDPASAATVYYGLHALQHRGQEGAGIVTSSPDGEDLLEHKGLGLVSEVFANVADLERLTGHAAIGHNRYSTAGAKSVRNVQPLVATFRDGPVSVAHNGNLTNAPRLRVELELRGSIFHTSSDTEVILHLMATSVSSAGELSRRVADALGRVEGAYSVLILSRESLVAVRDPRGFRPLVLGALPSGGHMLASESCALDLAGASLVREVEPGEMLVLSATGMASYFPFARARRRACVFEHIYFSKPSSVVFGRSVYASRVRFGELLAQTAGVPHADVVVPVPESGVPAALGFSAASGIPFQQGILRSHYVGRTFIQPSQGVRDIGVKLKLAPVRSVIAGKVVVAVDDSIVRGTTSKKIVRMLRDAGATEVHMRIACPPIIGSCYYGVDTPDRESLISFRNDVEATREYIGADSLGFLPLDGLHHFLGEEADTFCDACFSGQYPVLPVE